MKEQRQVSTVDETAAARQRRRRPGYDLDTLLDVCAQEFYQHGYDATSIGRLAEALHVSKSAIYHHVESKEALLALAVDRALEEVEATIADAESHPGTSLEKVEHLFDQSVRLLLTERPYVALLVRLRGNSPVEIRAMERRRLHTKRMEELVRTAQEDGLIRADLDAKATTRLVLGMINSITEWYRVDGSAGTTDLVHNVHTILIDGIRPRD